MYILYIDMCWSYPHTAIAIPINKVHFLIVQLFFPYLQILRNLSEINLIYRIYILYFKIFPTKVRTLLHCRSSRRIKHF